MVSIVLRRVLLSIQTHSVLALRRPTRRAIVRTLPYRAVASMGDEMIFGWDLICLSHEVDFTPYSTDRRIVGTCYLRADQGGRPKLGEINFTGADHRTSPTRLSRV
jgi:hypothetical protein